MDYFRDCTVVITGASSGLGREFALQLAPYAKNMVILARRLERLEALKSDIAQLHSDVAVYPYGANLANADELESFLKWLEETGMEVDFLINNAGVGDHGPFADGDWERQEQMFAVNIRALTRLTHHVLPAMIAAGEGAILNVSSVASLVPVPFLNVYAATKAYVTHFSEGLRAELRQTGVTVTALCPGPVPTEFGHQATRLGEDDKFDMSTPDFLSISAAQAAREGLRAVARDRARVVPGLWMFIGSLFLVLVPLFFIRPFLSFRTLDPKK